jgi:hypothetical protein
VVIGVNAEHARDDMDQGDDERGNEPAHALGGVAERLTIVRTAQGGGAVRQLRVSGRETSSALFLDSDEGRLVRSRDVIFPREITTRDKSSSDDKLGGEVMAGDTRR